LTELKIKITKFQTNLISFTGSTLIGRRIAALAAPSHKKLSLELGGKNAAVVFDDVDLDEVMPGWFFEFYKWLFD
jgi:acyl-CoA reductase-like NAD-dependent aldehyde dehydrogenase